MSIIVSPIRQPVRPVSPPTQTLCPLPPSPPFPHKPTINHAHHPSITHHSRALLLALGSNPLRLLCARLVREHAEWSLVLWVALALFALGLAHWRDGGREEEGEEEGEDESGWGRFVGGVDGWLLLLAVGALVAGALGWLVVWFGRSVPNPLYSTTKHTRTHITPPPPPPQKNKKKITDGLRLRAEPNANLDPSAFLVALLLARGGQGVLRCV